MNFTFIIILSLVAALNGAAWAANQSPLSFGVFVFCALLAINAIAAGAE